MNLNNNNNNNWPHLVISLEVSDGGALPVLGDDGMVPQSENEALRQVDQYNVDQYNVDQCVFFVLAD